MKRDVQVGVVLGVIILAIIGVFLSTRTTVKEPIIPIPDVEDDSTISMLDIQDLIQEPSGESQKEAIPVTQNADTQDTEKKKLITKSQKISEDQEGEKQDTIIEGVWKKAKDDNIKTVSANDKAVADQGNWMDIHSGDTKKSVGNFRIHKVQSKEDLCKIAKKYYGDASKWNVIFNANRDKIQDQNSLKIGMDLIIPEEKVVSQKLKTEMTTPSLSHVVEVEDEKPAETLKLAGKTHVVQQGDSFYKLAVKYYNDGAKWNKIFDANKRILKNQKSLKLGQELIIPEL